MSGPQKRLLKAYQKPGERLSLQGGSEAIRKLRKLIKRCAELATGPVLITGETGTGKEVAAQLIHEESARRDKAFFAVNCAHFGGDSNFANSDLFGHLKGAFSGAVMNREGAFHTADGGTLFLDELGELPLDVQAKLLRVLEDGMVRRLGGDASVKVDVRVIAATNTNLARAIRDGRFREDLFHRLDLLRVEVPPLRERREDVRPIARHAILKLGREGFKLFISPEVGKLLELYSWPGNVRQLIKVLKRAAYLNLSVEESLEQERTVTEPATSDPLEALMPQSPDELRPLSWIDELRSRYARRAFELCGQEVAETARRLEIAQNSLRKYAGLKKKRRRQSADSTD